MQARYFTDVVNTYLQTDFSLLDDDEVLEALIQKLEMVPGVESIRAGRYHIDILVAFMFNTEAVALEIVDIFKEMYGLDTVTILTKEHIAAKISGSSKSEDTISTLSEFLNRTPGTIQ